MDRTPHSRKLKQELEAALQGWEGKGIPWVRTWSSASPI